MSQFDPFRSQKQQAYKSSEMALCGLASYFQETVTNVDLNKDALHLLFNQLVQVSDRKRAIECFLSLN